MTGVDFDLAEHDVTVARRVLLHLEGKRVLFETYEQEDPEQCVASILALREYLSDEIASRQNDSPVTDALRAMRAACLEFLTEVNDAVKPNREFLQPDSWGPRRWWFDSALGGLRRLIGIQIAALSSAAKIEVPYVLEQTLPPDPRE